MSHSIWSSFHNILLGYTNKINLNVVRQICECAHVHNYRHNQTLETVTVGKTQLSFQLHSTIRNNGTSNLFSKIFFH